MLRLILAAAHLLALGIGLGAILTRGSVLREPITDFSLRRALRADLDWGVAALLWLGTGLWRYLGQTEKTVHYYDHNHVFLTKMGLFVIILGLEIWPMVVLMRWRRALRQGATAETIVMPDTARRVALISHIEALVVALMVFAAVAMARGYGSRG